MLFSPSMYAVVFPFGLDFPQIFIDCQFGWCALMESHEVAKPVEESSSLYRSASLLNFGVGVQFDVTLET